MILIVATATLISALFKHSYQSRVSVAGYWGRVWGQDYVYAVDIAAILSAPH